MISIVVVSTKQARKEPHPRGRNGEAQVSYRYTLSLPMLNGIALSKVKVSQKNVDVPALRPFLLRRAAARHPRVTAQPAGSMDAAQAFSVPKIGVNYNITLEQFFYAALLV
jgi:hypothetical protein